MESRQPSFAIPLPQSSRSQVLEWRFPKPHQHLILTGRSRAAWHTSFIIPSLNLLLDAGLCINKSRPKHIFLTHGHNDHTLSTPDFVKRDDPPDIYCPREVSRVLDDFILANTMLNLGGLIHPNDAGKNGLTIDEDVLRRSEEIGRTPSETAFLNTHKTHGVQPGDVITLRRCPAFTATAFRCHHSVPCLGFLFSQTSHRLSPEFAHLPGPELQAKRKAGVQLTVPRSTPIFAFLGDTTIETLAASPSWLEQGVPVVITECSFLYDEHKALAEKTKHTAWSDLEAVVRRWPRTTFVLTHFSMRYSDADVVAFFRGLGDVPPNIVVWADEQA